MNNTLDVKELQHLGFRRYKPHPSLSPWVQCYWSVSHPKLTKQFLEKLYPDGGTSLLFNFADGDYKGGWLHVSQELISSNFLGRVDCFGIRFHPGGAHQLLGLLINEFTQAGCCLYDESVSQAAVGLNDSLYPLSELQRVNFAEQWLFFQAKKNKPEVGVVQQLWQNMSDVSFNIDELLNESGVGRRKFERLLRQQVGLSPNRLKQLLRVKNARQLIKQNRQQSLSDIAVSCGYYDQPHFIRQFKKVTDQTPAEYRMKQLLRIKSGEMSISSES